MMEIPERPADGHKGTFGTVGIVGGQDTMGLTMVGAPALAARAALRIGCGRVMIASPRSVMPAVLGACLSATGVSLPQDESGELAKAAVEHVATLDGLVQAIAVGPGLGRGAASARLVSHLFTTSGPPLVLDADALHCLATLNLSSPPNRSVIVTPHLGEFAVLARALGLPVPNAEVASRQGAACMLAERLGVVVVLKGHGTVVADGSGEWTCDEGGVELAVPGSGDVLTGVLAGLLAQSAASGGRVDVTAASQLAVTLHARAGARWRDEHGTRGLLAEELPNLVGFSV